MTLSSAQIQAFKQDGYLRNIRITDDAQTQTVREQFNELESRVGREKCQSGVFDPHLTERFAWDLATHPRILDSIEAVIGPNILIMGTHFFCKYGPSDAFVAWHQDMTYWGLEPMDALSAWFAVDDTDAENGCMQVVPGTHRDGVREHGKSQSQGNLLSVNQELQLSDNEQQQVIDVALRAGEISLHHGLTIHGSQPNRSKRRRCGLAMVYMPTHLRQTGDNSLGSKWHTILVRGENKERHFDDQPHPFPASQTLTA